MSDDEAQIEEGEPEEYRYYDEETPFTQSGSLDAPGFRGWREQAEAAKGKREDEIMAAAAEAAPHLRKKMSASELEESAERQHAKRADRDQRIKAKQAAQSDAIGAMHAGKKADWDGDQGVLSRLYKAEDIQKKRTGSHQGNADFGSMLRGAASSPAAGASPRTPRTLAVKPGSTKKKSAAKSPAGGGRGGGSAGGGGRELAMATGERDRLKTRLQEVSAELELAKAEATGASAAQEALLEARAELEALTQPAATKRGGRARGGSRRVAAGGGGGGGGGSSSRSDHRSSSSSSNSRWEKHYTDDNVPYWWDPESNESVWDDPTATATADAGGGRVRGGKGGGARAAAPARNVVRAI